MGRSIAGQLGCTGIIVAATMTAGCGAAGARYVLEKPINDKCAGAGMKACPELTDGILLVVDGDMSGAQKVRVGLAKNEPKPVHDFVVSMRLLGSVPGAGPYVGPILAVLDTADVRVEKAIGAKRRQPREQDDATEPSEEDHDAPDLNDESPAVPAVPAGERFRKVAARPVFTAPAQPLDLSKWETHTVIPLTNPEARSCILTGSLSPLRDGGVGRCVRVMAGLIVVTELRAPGGCGADLFALGGSMSAPQWIVYGTSGAAVSTAPSFLVVHEREYFVIGTAATNENKLGGDVRCSITWSGFHP